MNSTVISICAAVAVLLAIGPVARPARVADRPGASNPAPRPRPLTSLGRILRTAAGRAPDPVRDARAGRCALAVALCLVVGVVPALGLLCAWALAARWRHLRRAQTETAPMVDDLPEVIDLLRLSLGAGLTIPAALPAPPETCMTEPFVPRFENVSDMYASKPRSERTFASERSGTVSSSCSILFSRYAGSPSCVSLGSRCSSGRPNPPPAATACLLLLTRP